jgi:trk system potassium uptake protein TrkA
LRLGIPTVAPVPWTSSQIVSKLLPGSASDVYADTAAGIAVRRVTFNDGWIGHPLVELEAASGFRVAFVVRFGEAVLPDAETVVQAQDELFFAVPTARSSTGQRTLERPPGVRS